MTKYLYIVDDEEFIRNALTRELRRWSDEAGLTIRSFADPQEILKALESDGESVWILISDQRMPFMDGLTLIKTINRKHPSIPGILMTGNIDIESITADNPPGVFSVIEKPWNHESLIRVLEQASVYRAELD